MNRKDGNPSGESSGEKKISQKQDEKEPNAEYNPELMLHFDRIRAQWGGLRELRDDEKNVEPKLPKRKPRPEDKKK